MRRRCDRLGLETMQALAGAWSCFPCTAFIELDPLSNYYWSWQQARDPKVRAEDRDPLVYAVSYINTASHSLESQILLTSKTENLGTSLCYILMDSILCYVPPSSGGRVAFLPLVGPFPSFGVTRDGARQTAL